MIRFLAVILFFVLIGLTGCGDSDASITTDAVTVTTIYPPSEQSCNGVTSGPYTCSGCDLVRCVLGTPVVQACAAGTHCENGICVFGPCLSQ
jgi:hypothetical protein